MKRLNNIESPMFVLLFVLCIQMQRFGCFFCCFFLHSWHYCPNKGSTNLCMTYHIGNIWTNHSSDTSHHGTWSHPRVSHHSREKFCWPNVNHCKGCWYSKLPNVCQGDGNPIKGCKLRHFVVIAWKLTECNAKCQFWSLEGLCNQLIFC